MNKRQQFIKEVRQSLQAYDYGHKSFTDLVDGILVRAALLEKHENNKIKL